MDIEKIAFFKSGGIKKFVKFFPGWFQDPGTGLEVRWIVIQVLETGLGSRCVDTGDKPIGSNGVVLV